MVIKYSGNPFVYAVLLLTLFFARLSTPLLAGETQQENAADLNDNAAINTDIEQNGDISTNHPDEALLSMSLEELLDMEITSMSKKKEKWFDSAAAIYVVTSEDIRRSGARNLPDALKMVPGMNVGQANPYIWSVGSRGFGRQYANKLLVMIDGRSVYSYLYGGVDWVMQDIMLENVERIEVIRGPGGTVWGANAVNGIINIITKTAQDTQGVLFTGGSGSHERGTGAVRYSGKAGENLYYMGHFKYANRDHFGDVSHDPMESLRGGFRLDWQSPESNDTFSVISEAFRVDIDIDDTFNTLTDLTLRTLHVPADISGQYILGTWNRQIDDDSEMSLAMYFDTYEYYQPDGGENRDTLDLDFNHSFKLGESHDINWGLGYRYTTDALTHDEAFDGLARYSYNPEKENYHIASLFLQDTITLVPDKLRLIMGSKFEHNGFTGFEYQPSVRTVYTPNDNNTLWASVTRAVKTPSRADRAVHLRSVFDAGGIPGQFQVFGDPDLKSEKMFAYELGYRFHPQKNLYFDIAGFFNDYDELTGISESAPEIQMDPLMHVNINAMAGNTITAETYGLEVSANWEITNYWRLAGAYSFIQIQVHNDNPNMEFYTDSEGSAPHNQFNVRSYLTLFDNVELDTSLYYVDNLTTGNVGNYIRFDARLGWHINENLELSLVGHNLANRDTLESASSDIEVTEIPRSLFAQLTWKF